MTQQGVPILPRHSHNIPGQGASTDKSDKTNDATTGATAAGVRALTARLAAFYFRVPVKAFFRTRVDYLAYPRAINPLFQSPSQTQPWTWRQTTPGILAHAVKTQGWSFLPTQVLPPLLANVTIGALLYTSYLHFLALFHGPAAAGTKRIYPAPSVAATFGAGVAAGAVQSVLAAPLDALAVRFRTADLAPLNSANASPATAAAAAAAASAGHVGVSGDRGRRYKTMWHYAAAKMREIGLRGAYAGASVSLVKDSLAAGLFFSVFETVKSQGFYVFVRRWYVAGNVSVQRQRSEEGVGAAEQVGGRVRKGSVEGRQVVRPHYLVEPAFLLLAGVAAGVAQQVVLHPLTQVQEVHWRRLEGLDRQMASKPGRAETMRLYAQAYRKTLKQCLVLARRSGGWRRWLFADFWVSTLRQVPSTSAGLIVFEIFRRKYGIGSEAARIEMDGYDILLP